MRDYSTKHKSNQNLNEVSITQEMHARTTSAPKWAASHAPPGVMRKPLSCCQNGTFIWGQVGSVQSTLTYSVGAVTSCLLSENWEAAGMMLHESWGQQEGNKHHGIRPGGVWSTFSVSSAPSQRPDWPCSLPPLYICRER
jgi:hypothetical protein